MLTIGQERSAPTEIDVGQNVQALTFTLNGEYLVSGHEEEVRVWRVKDMKQVTRMETRIDILSLAASKNGKWIAVGTYTGTFVWNAETYEQAIRCREGNWTFGVDFSPDSTRLVGATEKKSAIVQDLGTGKQVQVLRHQNYVIAAKYSPRGDRIATADTFGLVRVWDSSDGHSLVDIDVNVIPVCNTGLLWSNNHLLVLSDKKIEEFDVPTSSKVSEWPVPHTDHHSCIALPLHEQFIAYSAKRTITFWEISTHNQLPFTLQHPEDIHSIAFSPDDRILAIGGGRKIVLSPVSTMSCCVISPLNSFQAPVFTPSVCPTPYFSRTRHPNQRRYTRLVETRSARRRRSVIDCVDQPVAESEPSSTR